ncbi:NAD(P)H-hydrate dehydratase [Aquimonas voraii]|uniref:Bifunctional NAD(P)H-hydrate repair enzyme n=1 Tax=Aquimonas voraii TaxID=265719 RepID=A0A1G6SII6_9GAMM|nr:NAD(P)H-hydrate dehydratase [Aquimonas voraii]SDD16679.1 NAD(P)H-hydrate epimerase [Aquimonas voraii]
MNETPKHASRRAAAGSRLPSRSEADSIELFAEAAVRAIDARLIEALDGDAYALMQRAAWSALDALKQRWPRARTLAVVCGPGNNGGDGWVLARLAESAGFDAWVVHLRADDHRGSEEARRARCDWRGRRVAWEDDPELAAESLGLADLVVDAVFGLGLTRAPAAPHADLIEAINLAPSPVLALDLPSGVDADTGAVPGAAVRADVSISFVAAKPGLYTGAGRALSGERRLASLLLEGVDPPGPSAHFEPMAIALDARALAGALPRRRMDAHKGDSGHVLVLGGTSGMAGAALLCARAALRAGAGLVSMGTRAAHAAALVAAQPECMVRGVEAVSDLDPLLERSSVVALGPGLGQGEWGRALFGQVLAAHRLCVLDADALNLLAQMPRACPHAVLTPHPGEAARLLGVSTTEVQRDRYTALAHLVQRYECPVVLKGAGSLVGAPGEVPRVIDAGNPGMAVGGMGDLLAGVIAALIAQGLAAFDAAVLGALAHAVAGDLAAAEGERGLLPSDLLPLIRQVLNRPAESSR